MSESKIESQEQAQVKKNELQLLKEEIAQRANILMKDSTKARIDPNEQKAMEMQQLLSQKFPDPGALDFNTIDALTNLLSVTMGDTEDEQNAFMKLRIAQLEDFGKVKGFDAATIQRSRITQIKLQHVQMSMLRDKLGRNVAGYANAIGRTDWWRKFCEALLQKMATGSANPKYLHRKMFWTGIRSSDFGLHSSWLGMQLFMNSALLTATVKADPNWAQNGSIAMWEQGYIPPQIGNTIGAKPETKPVVYYEQGVAHMLAKKVNIAALINQCVPFHPLIVRFMPEYRNASIPEFADSQSSKDYSRLVNVALALHKMMLSLPIPSDSRLTGYFKGLKERVMLSEQMVRDANGVTIGKEGALVRIDSEIGSLLQKVKALTLRANRPETKRNPRAPLMIPLVNFDIMELVPQEDKAMIQRLLEVDITDISLEDPLSEAISEGRLGPGTVWTPDTEASQKVIELSGSFPWGSRKNPLTLEEAREMYKHIKAAGGDKLVSLYHSADKSGNIFIFAGESQDLVPESYSGVRRNGIDTYLA